MIIGYRGTSVYATVYDVSVSLADKEIAFTKDGYRDPSNDLNGLVTPSIFEVDGLTALENISETPSEQVKQLEKTLKYRAKAFGLSPDNYLLMKARSKEYPLTSTSARQPLSSGALYLCIRDENRNVVIGTISSSTLDRKLTELGIKK